MKLKNWNNFKLNEATNADVRREMAHLSREIKERGDTCFYIVTKDTYGFSVDKFAITENMRNGFESFNMDSNIKDVGEFIYEFAYQMDGEVILEKDIESLLESVKRTIDSEPNTEYLEDYPELDVPSSDNEEVE